MAVQHPNIRDNFNKEIQPIHDTVTLIITNAVFLSTFTLEN